MAEQSPVERAIHPNPDKTKNDESRIILLNAPKLDAHGIMREKAAFARALR
jgi:hypothetical protein